MTSVFLPADAWTWIDHLAATRGTSRNVELARMFREWRAAGEPATWVSDELRGKVSETQLELMRAVLWTAMRHAAPLAPPGRDMAKA